jgi:hypothetical protein
MAESNVALVEFQKKSRNQIGKWSEKIENIQAEEAACAKAL